MWGRPRVHSQRPDLWVDCLACVVRGGVTLYDQLAGHDLLTRHVETISWMWVQPIGRLQS